MFSWFRRRSEVVVEEEEVDHISDLENALQVIETHEKTISQLEMEKNKQALEILELQTKLEVMLRMPLQSVHHHYYHSKPPDLYDQDLNSVTFPGDFLATAEK